MYKELKDNNKLIDLQKALDEFLSNDDCKNEECDTCRHNVICNEMFTLSEHLKNNYIKK